MDKSKGQYQLNHGLLDAIKKPNYEEVKGFIEQGASVNQQADIYSLLPLVESCMRGFIGSAKLLIDRGADINKLTETTIAGIDEHKKYCNYTVSMNAFHAAVKHNHYPGLVNFLIANGVDVHAINKEGNNAIAMAVREDIEPSVKKLLKLGVDPFVKNNDGISAMDIAKEFKPHLQALIQDHLLKRAVTINDSSLIVLDHALIKRKRI